MTWIEIAGFFVSLFAVVGGAVKWLLAKIDKLWDEADKVHARINDVKDTYVRRDDFTKTFERIEKEGKEGRQEMKQEIEKLSNSLNVRLDQLLMAIKK